MPYAHRLQSSRFEFKYVIDEALVRPLRDFVRGYLQPDEHGDPAQNNEYEVCSLYLDSPSLTLCRATMQGHKNRFKLRIRFYDHAPDSPAYFEIKRRENDVILKRRAVVQRGAVGKLLAGQWPSWSDLYNGNTHQLGALHRFCALKDMINADGQAFVSYKREAYVTPDDDSVRITFDRGIAGQPYGRNWSLFSSQEPVHPRIGGVVLEMKFTDRFPNWLRQLVEMFNLERTSLAKYVRCIQSLTSHPMRYTMGQQGFGP